MTRRCAFLTTEAIEGFVVDDQLAVEPLRTLGWSVDHVPWQSAGDWSRFDLVVVRTPWDYQDHVEEFLRALERIDAATQLENSLELMRWNLDKRYLAELERRDVPIIPTAFDVPMETPAATAALFDRFGGDELVIKPIVSANADGAFRVPRAELTVRWPEIAEYYRNRASMIQPFVPQITSHGEVSVIALNGEVSHALLKVPKGGDFRVQEEHGGTISPYPIDDDLRQSARRVLDAIETAPLYARVDVTPNDRGEWRLMELEVIEPALYLRTDPGAPMRFAQAIDSAVRS